jgi:tetratricopeptide (TPR) repeat protein
MERIPGVATIAALFAASATAAAEPAGPTAAETALVEEVLGRLAAIAPPEDDVSWPPELEITASDDPNAFAWVEEDEDGERVAYVEVTTGLLRRIVEGKPDRLALLLGHEIGHHFLKHQRPRPERDATSFRKVTFKRDQELAADAFGMAWALRAGYSYREALGAAKRFHELADYAPVFGLAIDHPSWTERMAALDAPQAALWRSMGAFESGVYFLATEQYRLAERAYRQVTREFPGAAEAWANLGYALLMQYLDGLDPEDLRRMGLGHVLVGAFYRRAESLESQVRGGGEDLWNEAVDALRKARRLRPELALPWASLGVAFLARPSGPDPAEGARHLEAAAARAPRDASLDPLSRLAVRVNLAVAMAAGGRRADARSELDRVEAELRALTPGEEPDEPTLAAVRYNRGLALADTSTDDGRRSARTELEGYLAVGDPDSAFWPLAYERYRDLCSAAGVTPRTQASFRPAAVLSHRPVSSIELGPGRAVTLGEPLQGVRDRLGPGQEVPAVRGTNLVRVIYRDLGLEILANERVLAVSAVGRRAPPLPLRRVGLGAGEDRLQVGMTRADLKRLLGEAPASGALVDPEKEYHFYPGIGIAVRLAGERVSELVVVKTPRVRKASPSP